MTDDELNAMEAEMNREMKSGTDIDGPIYQPHAIGYVLTLVAEVRRLRAELTEMSLALFDAIPATADTKDAPSPLAAGAVEIAICEGLTAARWAMFSHGIPREPDAPHTGSVAVSAAPYAEALKGATYTIFDRSEPDAPHIVEG